MLLNAVLRTVVGPRAAATTVRRALDPSYRPPPIWGCEHGLPAGAFHVVVATLAPEPAALVPWIWNLGLSGAEIWIYHRLTPDDPRLEAAAATLDSFRPYPCNSTLRLQPLLPNKGREAAVYLSHIVANYDALPEGLVLIHDHGPAARHSLCGPFFRRLRGYYAGIREQRVTNTTTTSGGVTSSSGSAGGGDGAGAGVSAGIGEGRSDVAGRQARALAAEAAAGAGSGLGGASGRRSGGKGAATRRMLARFADMAVSLSSGCQENWLKGCCARLVCSEDGELFGTLPTLTSSSSSSSAGGFGGTREGTLGGFATALTGGDDAAELPSWQQHGPGDGLGGGLGSQYGHQRRHLSGRETRQLFELTGPVLDLGSAGHRHAAVHTRGVEAAESQAVASTTSTAGVEVSAAEVRRRARLADARRRARAEAEAAATVGAPRGRCPFKTPKCLAEPPGGEATSRRLYLHGGGGLYESRYENMIVMYGMTAEDAAAEALAEAGAGVANGGFGPLSLVRYAGQDALEMVRVQTSSSRSLDYPEGAALRTKQQTFAELGRILQAFNFSGRKTSGSFKSCCASLMLRPKHVRHWPLELYREMLSYTLDDKNTYHASLAVSHHGWSLWADSEVLPKDLLRYFEVDLALPRIRGCPGWRMLAEEVLTEGADAGG